MGSSPPSATRLIAGTPASYADQAASRAATVAAILASARVRLVDVAPIDEVHRLLHVVGSTSRVGIVLDPMHDLWSAHALALAASAAERGGARASSGRAARAAVKPLRELDDRELELESALALGDLHILRSAVGLRFGLAPPGDASPDEPVRPFRLHVIARGVASLLHDAAFMGLIAGPVHDHRRRVHDRLGASPPSDPRARLPFAALDPAARALALANVRIVLEALVLVCIDADRLYAGAPGDAASGDRSR